MSDPFEEISKMAQEGAFPDERDPDFTLPTELPEGPWKAIGTTENYWVVWDSNDSWVSSNHAENIARAIASIPDMVKEIERLQEEVDKWHTDDVIQMRKKIEEEEECTRLRSLNAEMVELLKKVADCDPDEMAIVTQARALLAKIKPTAGEP
jgi:hypothetical protein